MVEPSNEVTGRRSAPRRFAEAAGHRGNAVSARHFRIGMLNSGIWTTLLIGGRLRGWRRGWHFIDTP